MRDQYADSQVEPGARISVLLAPLETLMNPARQSFIARIVSWWGQRAVPRADLGIDQGCSMTSRARVLGTPGRELTTIARRVTWLRVRKMRLEIFLVGSSVALIIAAFGLVPGVTRFPPYARGVIAGMAASLLPFGLLWQAVLTDASIASKPCLGPSEVEAAVDCLRTYLVPEQRLRDAKPPADWVRPFSASQSIRTYARRVRAFHGRSTCR